MSPDVFWSWFAAEESAIRSAFDIALAQNDYPALEALLAPVAARIQALDPRFTVQMNGGKGAFRLVITAASDEGRAAAAEFVATAPALVAWSVGTTPIASAPKKIVTRDGAGRELVVAYDDLQFFLLPPKPDGTVSIMFCLDADFDPRGEHGHLYRAVSDELIKTLLGGTPSRLGTYALVPASMLAGRPTRPVTELAAAWAAATG